MNRITVKVGFAIGFLIMGVMLFSCKEAGPMNWNDYLVWLSNEDHGLVKNKEVNNVNLTVKFLSADYLAYQEMLKNQFTISVDVMDSLKGSYERNWAFVLTLEAEGGSEALLNYKVSNKEDYNYRVNQLSFHMDDYISLNIDQQTIKPLAVNYTHLGGFGSKIDILCVFSPEQLKEGTDRIDLKFDDPFWDLGINHFVFKRKHLEQLPELII